MRRTVFIVGIILLSASFGFAQKAKPKKPSAKSKAAAKPKVDMGTVSGRTYTNKTFGFEITFPDTWLIPDSDFEAYMKQKGFDVSLKIPASMPVTVLMTAYRSMPGTPDNAIARISVEDLKAQPQIKDAVDYFDAVRAGFLKVKLPADFKYSETQAEKLGTSQFGYIDTSIGKDKRRLYAVIRNRSAILLTLSYSQAEDLETFRQVIAQGNFALK